jgi:hypothetical protein
MTLVVPETRPSPTSFDHGLGGWMDPHLGQRDPVQRGYLEPLFNRRATVIAGFACCCLSTWRCSRVSAFSASAQPGSTGWVVYGFWRPFLIFVPVLGVMVRPVFRVFHVRFCSCL